MYNVVTFPNPVLSSGTETVKTDEFESGYVAKTAEAMAEVMLVHSGIGLAAPQIGISKKIIVIDKGTIETIKDKTQKHEVVVIANPGLTYSSNEKEDDWEGCLSFPGAQAKISRYKEIEIVYYNADGEKRYMRANGFLARCIQHEMDHLDGITMPDRLTGSDKLSFLTGYRNNVPTIGR